jgi:hypothetical protein
MNTNNFLNLLKNKQINYIVRDNEIFIIANKTIRLPEITALPQDSGQVVFRNAGAILEGEKQNKVKTIFFSDTGEVKPTKVFFQNNGDVYLANIRTLQEAVFQNNGNVICNDGVVINRNVKFVNTGKMYFME